MLSCVQLCDPMDCSLPGSSVHGSKNTGVIFLGVFPIQGSNLPLLRLLHLPLSHRESPINTQCYQVQPSGSHYWKVDWLLVMSLKSEDGLCYDHSISPGVNLTEERDLSYYERKTHVPTRVSYDVEKKQAASKPVMISFYDLTCHLWITMRTGNTFWMLIIFCMCKLLVLTTSLWVSACDFMLQERRCREAKQHVQGHTAGKRLS